MHTVENIDALEALYDDVVPGALTKVIPFISPNYEQWIAASRFLILTTVGPEGTDASPRGEDGPVVRIIDRNTLWLPDWRGNNRMDSLRNIVRDGRVSLMFMIPGCNNVVRINGKALLSTDPGMLGEFEKNGKQPRSVVVVTAEEVYFQCAKALMRSRLWQPDGEVVTVPTAGQFIKELDAGFDADAYDEGYPAYARDRMW